MIIFQLAPTNVTSSFSFLRWSDAPIMPRVYCSRAIISSWWPEYTEWRGYSINGWFLPKWHVHIQRWQYQDSSGSNYERVVQGEWDFFHTSVTTESRYLTTLRVLGCFEGGQTLFLPRFWKTYCNWMEKNIVMLQKLIEKRSECLNQS